MSITLNPCSGQKPWRMSHLAEILVKKKEKKTPMEMLNPREKRNNYVRNKVKIKISSFAFVNLLFRYLFKHES